MKVALQLYTIRDKIAKDYVKALETVAKIGYKAVEFAGHPFGTVPVRELKELLQKLGLKAISAHVDFKKLKEKPDELLNYAKELGLIYIVSEPNIKEIKSYDECIQVAKTMNEIGRKVKEYGMKFGMHNHAIEFEVKFEGKTVYDIFLENTDPSLVFFQADVFWIKYAGYDPVEVLKKLKGRCLLVHLKDMKDEVSKDFAELGQGILDFKKIVQVGDEIGVEWYIVENDRPSVDSFESIRIALEYLRKNFKVEE